MFSEYEIKRFKKISENKGQFDEIFKSKIQKNVKKRIRKLWYVIRNENMIVMIIYMCNHVQLRMYMYKTPA